MLQVAKDLQEQKEKEAHQIDPGRLRSLCRQCRRESAQYGRLQMHRVTAQEAKKKEEERRKMQKKREERKAKQSKKKAGQSSSVLDLILNKTMDMYIYIHIYSLPTAHSSISLRLCTV